MELAKEFIETSLQTGLYVNGTKTYILSNVKRKKNCSKRTEDKSKRMK